MEKRLYLLIGIFILALFSINFTFAGCEGIVNCYTYDSDGTNCADYGCTWDSTGTCINSSEHQPVDDDCEILHNEALCLEAGPSCDWAHCYGYNVACPNVEQTECDSIEVCQYDCCSGTGYCILYREDECPISKGCIWDTDSRCEGGEISDEGGLTCEDLKYQWMCDYYYPPCTWFGEGCTGTFSCPNDQASCSFDLGCYWSCPPCEVWWYIDLDEDLYSDGTSQYDCNRPENYYRATDLISTSSDCNDLNPNVNPGATEICDNEIDDDCDGDIDCYDDECVCSGVLYACVGEPISCKKVTEDFSGTSYTSSDCDENCGVCISSTEICDDEIDNDCDTFIDCEDGDCDGDSACITPEPVVYWADESDPEIPIDTSQTYTYFVETTTLKLVARNLEPGIEAIFEIYESDSPFGSDNIRVGESAFPPVTVNLEGVAVVDWTLSSSDRQAGLESGNDPPFEFYFKVNNDNSLKSEELVVEIEDIPILCEGITICSDCTQALCGICDVAEASVPDYINCELEGYNCRCEYDDVLGCQATWDGIEDDPDNPEGPALTIGTCTYITDDSIDPLGCEDDDYLSYGWEGVWTWAAGNEITQYDPNNKQAECEDSGVTMVACPAQIELPFFGTWGIIVTIALIIIIYLVLNMKKQKGKKAKKK